MSDTALDNPTDHLSPLSEFKRAAWMDRHETSLQNSQTDISDGNHRCCTSQCAEMVVRIAESSLDGRELPLTVRSTTRQVIYPSLDERESGGQ